MKRRSRCGCISRRRKDSAWTVMTPTAATGRCCCELPKQFLCEGRVDKFKHVQISEPRSVVKSADQPIRELNLFLRIASKGRAIGVTSAGDPLASEFEKNLHFASAPRVRRAVVRR